MLQKIENQQSGGKGSRFTASPGTRIAGIKAIADLVSYVKQYDERYKPNASSRVVDEDGKPLAEIVSRGFENAKANEAEYGSLESGVRYSKEDILDKFGIEERKLSDYIYVQRKVFDTLKSEGFFTEFDKSNNRYYRIDRNIETGIEVETNKSGIFETLNLDNYSKLGKSIKLLKLITIQHIHEIITNGKIVVEGVKNIYDGNPNKKFAYIQGNIRINGDDYTVKIAVKQSPYKNKFWVHYVYMENGIGNKSEKAINSLTSAAYIPDAKERIPQSDPKSNSKSEIQGPKSKDDTIYLSAVERGDI